MKMNDLLIDFVDFLKSKKRSKNTIIAYRKDLEQFLEFLTKQEKITDINKTTTEIIQNFIKYLFKKGMSPKTVSRKINTLKTFFRFLDQEKKIITSNPALDVEHPRIPSKGPRFLSKLEYRALRDVVRNNRRIYAIIELMLQTGLRIGEVARLHLEDYKKNKLYIRPFESHKEREVPLNKNAREAIDNYLKVRPQSKDNHLFLTRLGTPLSVRNIRASITRAFKKAGIENATVSDIRHTFIAQQLLRGTPLVVVSKIVGHKRIETTIRYLDYLKEYNFRPNSLPQL